MRAKVIIGAVATAVLAASAPAGASPVCAEPPREVCGGRIFPEAVNTVSFVQHDPGEYAAGIRALAEEFPRYVKVRTFSDVLGHEVKSFGGRDIYLVEITDFQAPEDGKVPVAVSLSVHGPERAGLEGGVRYMEDLARWAADEPNHELRNGTEKDSVGIPVSEALKRVHLYIADINPDGWSSGDAQNGGVFMRGNDNGVDLNREFPTMGWSYPPYTALSEPESKAWDELMQRVQPRVSADLHGELTSAQNAFADMMYPAGEYDPRKLARMERLARHMKSNVERYFERDGVEAGEASGVAGMKPAEYATGYDVVGYDAAGFMGDWFSQEFGAIDMDVEHFLSHMVPNTTWFAPLEEAHIASVRGEIEALVVEATEIDKVKVKMNLGRVAYLKDRRVVKSKDGYGGPKPPDGVDPASYRVSRMEYFKDLSRHARSRLRALSARRIAKGLSKRIQTLVISDLKPAHAFKKARQRKRAMRSIRRWVKRGGNLILTDSSLKLLPSLGVVKKKAVSKRMYNAGHINIDNFKHRYTRKVHTTASQTYYEVPLGFSIDVDASPHWIVKQGPWRKAKGKKVAHVEVENEVALGRARMGRGSIGIFGAILPQPTEKFDHFYGLAPYAVSVAGGQIFTNMLASGR